ncbi:MAG: lysine--tRNA ligase [Acidimicrobiales bacterium]|jgi:lysyl-tRNA synthetase class 2|nr:lysine--tRNA ligase [Acidimicrobiales bacterium]MDP6299273.1 lysine--tRNA ligase [Acidimicrobiales bacterium]HJM28647.1 lysine--tRNA ligase [Acidimicrobiales bacterium]HJM97957.1 lysine--tRNA ligase [Acidimicrobiales bacterium]
METPYNFDKTATVEELINSHNSLEDGTGSGITVSVAGRMMLRRDQGKIAFGVLQDGTGRIQLFAPSKVTPDFEKFVALNLGDWIGVTGEVMKTKRGELSVKVSDWVVLATTQTPFPDKWHGISDPDTRYRQRYVDLWVTDEARKTFILRSSLISLTRKWLEERSFMEVETPVFHPIPGGALAKPFTTHHNALDIELYLRIAPELYLKRLIVGGFEKVFEIARVFRNEGLSSKHNPEFTMLELYEAYADWEDIMKLAEGLIEFLAVELTGSTLVSFGGKELNLSTPWRRASMVELIKEYVQEDISLETPIKELRALCDKLGIEYETEYGPGKLILEIYEKSVEPNLWDPCFVTEYPKEVSPLSRDHREKPGYTERFEGIVAGREILNGFSELIDPEEQMDRFKDQLQKSKAGDEEAMGLDTDYVRALEFGLPPTGGIGIGIDRLVMLLADVQTIRDVVLFPTLRPE